MTVEVAGALRVTGSLIDPDASPTTASAGAEMPGAVAAWAGTTATETEASPVRRPRAVSPAVRTTPRRCRRDPEAAGVTAATVPSNVTFIPPCIGALLPWLPDACHVVDETPSAGRAGSPRMVVVWVMPRSNGRRHTPLIRFFIVFSLDGVVPIARRSGRCPPCAPALTEA